MAGSGSPERRGLAAALSAFSLWGLFPLFIALLAPAAPIEIAAHRVVWTFLVCVLVLAATRGLRRTWALASRPRLLARLALAGALLATNWLIFVISVEIGRVVDASLGYFLNPLMSAGIAVVVLRERLRPLQWVSLSVAGVGIVVMVIGMGSLPWIAFALAGTFGIYGLIKKQVGPQVTALSGLSIETTALLLPALGYLIWLTSTGASTFWADTGAGGHPWHSVLLISSGAISAVPLLLFAAAARRLPLATTAMTQFMTPVLQFLVGVLILGEQMSTARWVGFAFVWSALVVLTIDIVRSVRGARLAVAGP